MSPIPDDPGKNQDDDIDRETPQFVVAAGSESDSDPEEDPTYLGYQPLPQEPETDPNTVQESNANGTQEEINLDKKIMDSLSQQEFQFVPQNQASDSACYEEVNSACKGIDESAQVWNEPRTENAHPMAKDEADKIRAAMEGFSLPVNCHPEWARSVSEDEWKKQLFRKLHIEKSHIHSSKPQNPKTSDR